MGDFKGKTLIRIIDPITKNIDEIEVDCTLSRSHSETAKVTDHKVEEGYKITDHIITEPIKISLDCIISDEILDNPTRIFTKLSNARENKNICTIVTSDKVYKNMAIETFNKTNSSGKGKSLYFKLDLKEIRTAKTKISKLTTPKIDVKKLEVKKTEKTAQQNKTQQKKTQSRYQPKKSVGKVQKKEIDAFLSKKFTTETLTNPLYKLPVDFKYGF